MKMLQNEVINQLVKAIRLKEEDKFDKIKMSLMFIKKHEKKKVLKYSNEKTTLLD